MNWYQKKLSSILGVFFSTLFFVSCNGVNEVEEKSEQKNSADEVVEILIGTAGPLTGPQSHIGKDLENGVRFAIEYLNENPIFIQGKKAQFRMLSEDDQADPKQAVIVAQSFVDEGVSAVIGHLNSGASIPASRVYFDSDVIQITPASTNPDYTRQGFATTFRLVADDVRQSSALADYAVKQLKVKTVAIIDDKTQYGEGLAREFQRAVESLGVEVLSVEHTTDKSVDFSTILTNIKSKNPDLVFFGGMDPQGGALLKQMRRLGIDASFMAGDGCSTDAFLENAGKEAAQNAYTSLVGLPISQMPGGQHFLARFKERFGVDPILYAPYSYDATMLIAKAIEEMQSIDSVEILSALKVNNYEGVTSDQITFDDKGDLTNASVTIYKVENGAWAVTDSVISE